MYFTHIAYNNQFVDNATGWTTLRVSTKWKRFQ